VSPDASRKRSIPYTRPCSACMLRVVISSIADP
jgi:hypothetical protein